MTAAIAVDGLSFEYPGVRALDDVCFAFGRLVLPDLLQRPGFATAVMAVQAAVAVAIAAVRWRRNHGAAGG